MQLLEMNIPVVVALNMMDELRGTGIRRYQPDGEHAGSPGGSDRGRKNEGIDELVRHAVHIAHYQERPARQDFCDANDHGGAVHRCLHAVIHLIEDHAERAGLPPRFAADTAIAGDHLIIDQLARDKNELEMQEHIVLQMEKERGLDRSAAMADMRFAFIQKVCEACVVKPHESREHCAARGSTGS